MAITQNQIEGLAQHIFECFKSNGDVNAPEAVSTLVKCETPAEMRAVMDIVKAKLKAIREKQAKPEDQPDAEQRLER